MEGVKVLKFGGTSMGSAKAMERVISIIEKSRSNSDKSGVPRAVVVSAMSGVTNRLVEIAKCAAEHKEYERELKAIRKMHEAAIRALVSSKNREKALAHVDELLLHLEEVLATVRLVRVLSVAELDYIMSFGERLSAHILTEGLNDRAIPSEYLNARKVIVTDGHFGAAGVDFKATNAAVRKYFRGHNKLQVVTGFIGATPKKRTTTLGRGGSDYSAAIVGAALGARVIEIWTDVSGIYTADPRLVHAARVVPELAFEEAGELAYFGAKVLHPKTILPAMREGIPVKVLNTFKPNDNGTTIVSNFKERRLKSHTVEALSFKRPVTIVHINSPEFFDANGLMAGIFSIFDKYRTSVDVVATSVAAISLTIDNEKRLPEILGELKRYGEVSLERNKAIVCAVGGSINTAGVAGKMFTALGNNKINVEMISQASSAVSITFIVHGRDAERALKVLHKEYIR